MNRITRGKETVWLVNDGLAVQGTDKLRRLVQGRWGHNKERWEKGFVVVLMHRQRALDAIRGLSNLPSWTQ